jgi:hypothetical protein
VRPHGSDGTSSSLPQFLGRDCEHVVR